MPPDSSSFTALNVSPSAVPESMDSFSLSAAPDTDLWRKPPSSDTSTCPILYTALRSPFRSAEVTVAAEWEIEWDQAGLVIFAGAPPGRVDGTRPTSLPQPQPQPQPQESTSTARPATATRPEAPDPAAPPPAYAPPNPCCKWVKVGLEFNSNACHATSVCATADGADWSLTALHNRGHRQDLRVRVERIGHALWVSYEDENGAWKKMREVTFFFCGIEDKAVRVGVYASRPANLGPSVWERRHGGPRITQRNLVVDFEGLEIF